MNECIIDLENVERVPLTPEQLLSFNSIPLREKIVRCRDCAKWSLVDVDKGVRFGICKEFSHDADTIKNVTRENGFCMWGERVCF